MVLRSSAVLFAWALSAASLSWFGAEVPPGPQGPQGATASLARGAVVTFERRGPADARPEVHVQRARLLSLAVERGETPSPFLSPGWFRASYRATVTLPVRDRYRFRVEGRGSFKLTLNGEVALEGALRPGKPVESKEPSKLKKGGNELQLDFSPTGPADATIALPSASIWVSGRKRGLHEPGHRVSSATWSSAATSMPVIPACTAP